MRISSLVLIASSVFVLASATPTNHGMIARHAEEAREVAPDGPGGPDWKREAEAEAARGTAAWKRGAEPAPYPPGWKRAAKAVPPGW